MKRIWEKIVLIWKDPVWSKVIASAIIFIFATIWAKYNKYDLEDIYGFFMKFLSFRFPVYFYLSLIAFVFLIRFIIYILKKKRDPIWDEQIGNYTFKELYEILENQTLAARTQGMIWSGKESPNESLLTLFYFYSLFLNQGVTVDDNIEDGGYLYGVLSPKLLSYGLVDQLQWRTTENAIIDYKYQTSVLGHKFYSLLERLNYKSQLLNTTK